MTTLEEISALTQPHHPAHWTEVDSRAVDTARVLAADAVQKVGNGHPGTAMSLAPLAYTLFQRAMRHDPADTEWLGRDRFVLSCGHSSLTLYIQLYLGGFGLELSDIEALRTWESKTPGHPEYRHTKGVEITTGPLGQGLASAVGMAMAARFERGLFDPDAAPGTSPFDHYIYVIASDGDMEEGVTSEACSLAGTQQLGNLIVFWDNNEISIEHNTNIAFTENTPARYEAYGWHVQVVEGGENVADIEKAIEAAKKVTDKPSFIALRTIIGYPAPTKMNTGGVHGSALGADEVAATKKVLGFDPDKTFEVTDEVIAHTRALVDRGRAAHEQWQGGFDAWAKREPERKKLLDRLLARELPAGWDADLTHWEPGRVRSGPQRRRDEATRTLGWFGGSGGEQQHHHQRCPVFRTPVDIDGGLHRRLVWPGAALRHPRARDGRDPVGHRAARSDPRLRRHLHAVLRLHAPGRAFGGVDGYRSHLYLDARLNRPGRGRPHPPTHRASGRTARHSELVGGAPGRPERDRLRVACDRRTRYRCLQRSGRVHPDQAGSPGARRHQQ